MRILIVDDEQELVEQIRQVLTIQRYTVDTAFDGVQALDSIYISPYDLILLDIMLPKKDGFTVVKEIIAYDPNAKIILITASDDQKIIQQCLDHGASSYISKPFDFNGVLESIKSLI